MRTVKLTEKVGPHRKGAVMAYDDRSAEQLLESGRAEAVEVAPPFDPSEHTVEEVVAYMKGADVVEVNRVLGAERGGKARVGVLDA